MSTIKNKNNKKINFCVYFLNLVQFTYFVCCTLFVASGFNQEYIPLDFLDSEHIIPLDFFKIMLFIRLYFCKTLRNSFIFCTFAPDFIT